MRILLNFNVEKDCVYDMLYYKKLQGFFYKLLKGSAYDELHDKRTYKYFCFSNIFPVKDFKENEVSTMIIVNNVKKSIELYEKFGKNEEDGFFLLNSRLTEKVKGKRIEKIKERLDEGKKVILVSTQMVEASVDVDFDFMITEVSPIDSQIQRWGRINRNKENKVVEPNIIVFSNFSKDRGSKAIYDEEVMESTVKILKKFENQPLNYEKERELIDDVFGKEEDGNSLTSKYILEIKKNLDYLKYLTAEKRSDAQRIFRRLGGMQMVIPQLMEIEEQEENEKEEDDVKLRKTFAKIINDRENNNISWNEILDKLQKDGIEISENNQERKNLRWKLKKILYEYSVNLPEFYLAKPWLKWGLVSHEFKGFFVMKKQKKETMDSIREKGIDVIKDIDKEEINQFGNNII